MIVRGRISVSHMNQISRASILLAVLLLTAACLPPREPTGAQHPGPSDPLDPLVGDLCNKSVVMLGEEDHHGGGRTAEIKADLVRRLIDRCGFDAVYFESSLYEFVDLDRRLSAATSAPEQLADAIGGLWNRSVAIDPLVSYLYARASAGRLHLAGLDPQLGSATSGYEKGALVDEMLQGLDEPRRSTCAADLSRHVNWRYDDEHRFDAAQRDRLLDCFREAGEAAQPGSVASVLAHAASAALPNPSVGMDPNGRERQMAVLFRWHRQRSPATSKVIVWTANVHAARSLAPVSSPLQPFGSDLQAEYGARLASIAFTSLGGAYGFGNPTLIPPAPPDSLEARAMADETKQLRYLAKAQLADLGEVDAWLLAYGKPRHANWSLLFDGVVVLREEKPQSMDRPATPRFVPAVGRDRG